MSKRLLSAAVLLLAAAVAVFAQAGSFGSDEGRGSGIQQPVFRTFTLTINSNLRGATIYIDGVRQRELTPATIRLREGTYTVRVESRGYDSYQSVVRLNSNQSIYARLIPPTATVVLEVPGQLLNTQVRDPWRLIDFYVDGRLRTESRVQVESGWHTVTIVSGGLRFEDEFFFEAGRFYTLEVILEAALYQGR